MSSPPFDLASPLFETKSNMVSRFVTISERDAKIGIRFGCAPILLRTMVVNDAWYSRVQCAQITKYGNKLHI